MKDRRTPTPAAASRTSPFSQAGIGAGGRPALYGFGLLGAGRALGLVLMAEAVARGISSLVAGTSAWRTALVLGLAGALLRGLLAWGARVFSARSARKTQQDLRADLARRLLGDGGSSVRGTGSTAVLATSGLEGLDDYYRSVLPALTGVAVIPLLVGIRLLAADWISAGIVAATILLVPLFLALIGMHTAERVAGAQESLARLSDHIVDLARGLPVLVGLGRAEEQTRALKEISDDHRTKTLGTLRVAFLSGLALELVSTISVAVVAVFIGFRLVNGTVTLEIALLVLILAPECFAPFRDLGASFHASQDGLSALRRAREIIDAPAVRPLSITDGPVGVHDLHVRYRGRAGAALEGVSFRIPDGTIASILGPSGCGKSTLLGVLAGQIDPNVDGTTVTGTLSGVNPARTAWLPQHPQFTADTVASELELYGDDTVRHSLRCRELQHALGLESLVDEDPLQLSPGEARRLGLARALLRVDAGASLLLLDEPTAHLEDASARVVRRLLLEIAGRATVVIASHDARIADIATLVVRLGASTLRRESYESGVAGGEPAEVRSASRAPANTVANPGVVLPARPEAPGRRGIADTAVDLTRFLRPAAGRYLGAAALGTLSAVFGLALTAVSGWLIVKASTHPAVMYLLVAIVGVRFFGIGRSALRYAERLVTHDAVFESVTRLRLRLWDVLRRRGATSRKLLGGASVVDTLIGSGDRVRDLAPRVLLPVTVALTASAAVVVTVALLHAPALPLVATALVLCLVAAPALTLRVDRKGGSERQRIQSRILRRFTAMLGAADDLRCNGVGERAAAEVIELDRAAGRRAQRGDRALGLGGALVTLVCCATSVSMLIVTATAVGAGTLAPEIVAVLVLLPLGLLEPLLAGLQAVQSWPALAVALHSTGRALDTAVNVGVDPGDPVSIEGDVAEVELVGLAATWPDAPSPAFSGASGRAVPGRWLVVEGPSGSGKSTLLTVLLGSLRPGAGRILLNGHDIGALSRESIRARVAWAPQDGHLFDSTLRANLAISRDKADRPSDGELVEVLERVGLRSMLDAMDGGLDTRVGPGGSNVSGGERQRIVVARALLTGASVMLLDEPTAHLDDESAEALLADLRSALSDVVVVLVTHHDSERNPGDERIVLGDRPLVLSPLVAGVSRSA